MNQYTQFEGRFLRFLRDHRLVRPDDHILLAVSGGCDSMVMMRLFHNVRPQIPLALTVAHVNHQLRGSESERDEESVRTTAAELELPVVVRRIDLGMSTASSRASLQARARTRRYAALEEIRTSLGAATTATAHHQDDQAETVLLNLLRGAGVRGLAGIPVRRSAGSVIRPLLFARRSEIERYARDRSIPFESDSSNASLHYERNVLRHRILPTMAAETGSDPVEVLCRLSLSMASLRDRLEQEVEEQLHSILARESDGAWRIDLRRFLALPEYLRQECVLELFRRHDITPSVRKVDAVLRLAGGSSGHRIDLGPECRCERDRESLRLGPPCVAEEFCHIVHVGTTYRFPGFTFSSRRIDIGDRVPGTESGRQYVDSALLHEPLALRSWRHGDWFLPLGLHGRKKISDLFSDMKATGVQKSTTPLLTSGGKIAWVCGMRLDDRFKLTSSTAHAVELLYRPHDQGMP